MKKITLTLILSLLAITTQGHCRQKDFGVVSRTYLHKYGLEIPQSDWVRRGKDGKIISKFADGTLVVNSYSHGVLEGESTYSFPHNHTIERAEFYTSGNLDKKVQNYVSGNPERETLYLSPTKQKVTEYFENGIVRSVQEIEGENIISGEYYDLQSKAESFVNSGDGMRVNRDSFGELLSHDLIENGQMILRTTFHANGSPKAKTPYVNGMIHGKRHYFYPSGEPEAIEEWVSNSQHGLTVYYKNGDKISEIPYVSGSREGIEKRYNDDGDVVEEVSWSRNQRHGPTFTYVEDIMQAEWFYKDRAMTKSSFDRLKKKRL